MFLRKETEQMLAANNSRSEFLVRFDDGYLCEWHKPHWGGGTRLQTFHGWSVDQAVKFPTLVAAEMFVRSRGGTVEWYKYPKK